LVDHVKDIISFDKRVNPKNASTETKPDLQLEIAHILLIDVVGYSKLLVNEQIELLQELKQVVRSSESFRAAEARDELIRVPTGDGIALVFFHSPEEPVRCALEISRALLDHPSIRLRMGIHSGPVNRVTDVNEKTNIAGSGINVAQRVLDCGDAGHILLSAHVAEDLAEYRHWQPHLHELGECEVKYGLRLHLFNLYKDGLGNPQVPEKLRRGRRRPGSAIGVRPVTSPRWPKVVLITALVVSAIAGVISSLIFFNRAPSRAPGPGERPLSALASIPEKSIAVLPFENLSNEKENAYFADGVQDEILTGLSRVADLKVISRTSVMHYKAGPKRNLREVATDLGVAHVLEGTVQRAGGRVRVNAQLIDARTDSQLWAERYDREIADVFAIESELAEKIVAQLRAQISPSEKAAIEQKPTNNPEAYDAYLRGLAFEARYSSSYSPDLIRKATAFYERAVQLDPNFALAWARVSRANGRIYYTCDDTTCIARREAAKRALENAQKLEPNSPETLLALGYYQYRVLRDYGPAKATFERVSQMLPGSSEVPYALAVITRRKGQWDQSVAYWERALALDPSNMELLMLAAETYDMLRQFPAALRLYDRALDITPNDPDVIVAKAGVYQAEGDLQEAARLLSEINEKTSNDGSVLIKINQLRLERRYTEAIRLLQARLAQFHFDSEFYKGIAQVNLAFAQYLAGDRAGAKITAEQARNTLDQFCRNQPDNAYLARLMSLANAALGEKDSALKEAERAIMLEPRAQDAISGPGFEENLALIQTIFGENSRAIPTLTQLLQTPYMEGAVYGMPITPALLRFDPIWDPLRADPAFQKLCAEKQP
jgi:TolB-like protein/class 3 adenylate cyclase/Tfp pilus assembly protein PilF